jgi:hypothetical protein
MSIWGWLKKTLRGSPWVLVGFALRLPEQLLEDRFHTFLNEAIDSHAGGFMPFLYRVAGGLLDRPMWTVAIVAILIMLGAVYRQIQEEKKASEIKQEMPFGKTVRYAVAVSGLVLALGVVIALVLPPKPSTVKPGPSAKQAGAGEQKGPQQAETGVAPGTPSNNKQQQTGASRRTTNHRIRPTLNQSAQAQAAQPAPDSSVPVAPTPQTAPGSTTPSSCPIGTALCLGGSGNKATNVQTLDSTRGVVENGTNNELTNASVISGKPEDYAVSKAKMILPPQNVPLS